MSMCPICGGDRMASMEVAIKRINEVGLKHETINPGGRLLVFDDGRELQIHDQCCSCDSKRILDFIGNSGDQRIDTLANAIRALVGAIYRDCNGAYGAEYYGGQYESEIQQLATKILDFSS